MQFRQKCEKAAPGRMAALGSGDYQAVQFGDDGFHPTSPLDVCAEKVRLGANPEALLPSRQSLLSATDRTIIRSVFNDSVAPTPAVPRDRSADRISAGHRGRSQSTRCSHPGPASSRAASHPQSSEDFALLPVVQNIVDISQTSRRPGHSADLGASAGNGRAPAAPGACLISARVPWPTR